MTSDYLSVNKAAELLDVHPQTIRNWYRNGVLKAYRPNPGGKVFILQSDLNSLMSKLVNENKNE